MNKPPRLKLPQPATQANSSSSRSTPLQPYLPPALLTPVQGMRRATTQKRELIGGGSAQA